MPAKEETETTLAVSKEETYQQSMARHCCFRRPSGYVNRHDDERRQRDQGLVPVLVACLDVEETAHLGT